MQAGQRREARAGREECDAADTLTHSKESSGLCSLNLSQDRREAFYRERIRNSAAQYPDSDGLSAEATFGMLYTYDLLHQIMGRQLSGYGLSRSTLNILMLLKQGEPQGMLLSDLGELMLVSRANITGLIDHLESKGYVKRVVDVQDRRGRFARLTKHGKELIDRYAPVHFRNITELMKDLSGEEKETLVALLHKARESLRSHAVATMHQGRVGEDPTVESKVSKSGAVVKDTRDGEREPARAE